jgi:hypothetical protein
VRIASLIFLSILAITFHYKINPSILVGNYNLWHNLNFSLLSSAIMFDYLKQDISIVFDRDPAARTRFEILTTYPGVHALILHRFSHWLWNARLYWLGRFFSHIGRFLTGI